ncbi:MULTISPECIES: sulfur carrier protein ThiS adenylyltransferase ThiF [unclassified Campylobacter]|uniref:sulfur carrier protein ThiS adenylyltransferase ThiF n=1 Tax=unclassified Campylobacter TaxID=2593542 RepID=UPI0022E9C805|nr:MULTISPECIES: sulfur carrier protein ThiS adenylyltransferase ThiF [unclassified Campylobacter]MDA3078979.1 sulfur carrier protein ThiS adenylyltransferase ThiF [Campylobacter sp. CS_NA2]MDA3080730.1 sulfur carrier protein ThiS adenylyltransferase ThiF [Campylobacter sp. CS_NA1]MDA3085065.1 sulfur carrier protein ThiS adenylyltransferase ThiF [Campylobacter sp. CS_ED1]MDA3089842.1 sulfur carrier protein ThiS adenylyltransferase ThiF [Campylobacter sp. CS_ED2]WBR51601.1 sulfur carrier protei
MMNLKNESEFRAEIFTRNPRGVSEILSRARVCILGAGGLGSNVAIMLTRAGVGEFFIIDFDIVEPSNLNRQHYFLKHLGSQKIEALKEQILGINPYAKVQICGEKITSENVREILRDEKIICECFDGAENKAMIANLSAEYKDKIFVCASGMAGLGEANSIQTRKFGANLYLCGDGKSDMSAGLIAPHVITCAAHQANAVITAILNKI